MANTKISALPAASALAGTEAIPAVQSGANVKLTPAQIATYIGATVSDAARPNTLLLRRALADISDGTRTSLRCLVIGDSLATFGQPTFYEGLMEQLFDPYFPSDQVYHLQGALDTGAIMGIKNAGTATRSEKTYHQYSYAGNSTQHTSGQTSAWAYGGSALNCDRIFIPVITAVGAGTIKITVAESAVALAVASGSWRNPTQGEVVSGETLISSELVVDANAAAGLHFVELEFATLAQRVVKITQASGGTVYTFDPMFEVKDGYAVNSYHFAAGSNTFGDADSACIPYMAAFVTAYDPDLIVIESDDSLAAYQNFLPKLLETIEDSGVSPAVILVGNPGIGTGFGTTEADLALRIAYCASFAATNNWCNFDGLAFALGIANLTEVQWAGDEVHLTQAIWFECAKKWATDEGLMNFRLERAGGDAASKADLATSESARFLTAANVLYAIAAHTPMDTGWMTWAFVDTGTAGGSKNPAHIALLTGATAGSTTKGYVNDNYAPWNSRNGYFDTAVAGAWKARVRVEAASANGIAYLYTSREAYNAPLIGAFTAFGHGFGFRISNAVIQGVAWNGSAQVVTSGSATADTGVTSHYYELIYIWSGTIAAGLGTVEFFVNGVSLGSLQYQTAGDLTSPLGLAITNGADAAANTVRVTPPLFLFLTP